MTNSHSFYNAHSPVLVTNPRRQCVTTEQSKYSTLALPRDNHGSWLSAQELSQLPLEFLLENSDCLVNGANTAQGSDCGPLRNPLLLLLPVPLLLSVRLCRALGLIFVKRVAVFSGSRQFSQLYRGLATYCIMEFTSILLSGIHCSMIWLLRRCVSVLVLNFLTELKLHYSLRTQECFPPFEAPEFC